MPLFEGGPATRALAASSIEVCARGSWEALGTCLYSSPNSASLCLSMGVLCPLDVLNC